MLAEITQGAPLPLLGRRQGRSRHAVSVSSDETLRAAARVVANAHIGPASSGITIVTVRLIPASAWREDCPAIVPL